MNLAESIKKQGYALIPGVFGQKEIDRLLRELGRADLPRSRAGVRHAMRIPAVAEMARGAELVGIAREILGEGAFPLRATLFDKSATGELAGGVAPRYCTAVAGEAGNRGLGPVVGEGWRAVCACSGEIGGSVRLIADVISMSFTLCKADVLLIEALSRLSGSGRG